jgi:hypothetical protein
MENNTLNSTVCKLAEEQERMISFITDPDINNFVGITTDADMYETYTEIIEMLYQDEYERYREDGP